MKRLLFSLLLVLVLGGASISLLPPSHAQSGFTVCDVASGAVCVDPATAELEDPDDPDIIPPVGGGFSALATVGANVLVNDPNDLGKPQNEPYIAMNPDTSSHLMAGGNDYSAPTTSGLGCGIYRSTNGGDAWDPRGFLPLSIGFAAASDPGLAFGLDLGGGQRRIFYSCVQFNPGPTDGTIFVVFSDDGGVTFPDANRRVVANGGPTVFQDKPFIAVDTTNSANRGNVYVSWTRITSNDASIQVARSTSGGTAWTIIGTVSTAQFNQGSVPFVGPDGTVYVAFARLNPNTIRTNAMFIVRSTDGGVTWSAPITVATGITGLPNNKQGQPQLVNTKFRVNSFPTAVVDTSSNPATTGNLYIAWSAYRNATSTNADIFVSRSVDGGLTWSAPLQFGGANDQFFPWLSVDPNGNLDIVYYSRTNTTKARFNLKHRRSTDGALTFGAETQINDGGVIKAAQFQGTFIDDYMGAVSSPTRVHPVWMDSRRLKPNSTKVQQDIFGAAVTP